MADPTQKTSRDTFGQAHSGAPQFEGDDGSLEALVRYSAGVTDPATQDAGPDRRAAGDKDWVVTP